MSAREQDRLRALGAAAVPPLRRRRLSSEQRDRLATVLAPLRHRFICESCRTERHGECPGDTWCDCQHRVPKTRRAT